MKEKIEIEIKIIEAQISQLRLLRSVPSAPVDQVEIVLRRERVLMGELANLSRGLPAAA